jgi:acetoin utilization deacetylase AcuC-like enzyme
MRKYRLLREALSEEPSIDLKPAPMAPLDAIELAHDAAYVRGFVEGSLPAAAMRRIGFPWSQGLVDRSLASAGSTLQCAFDVLQNGCAADIAGGLSGGTHHAFRSEGSGFCVFNDIAVAILALRKAGLARRAAVIDLDVHQGDGTAAIFAGDPQVFTFSMHGANNFPFRKQQSSLDVELPDGAGDELYLEKLRTSLDAVWQFRPEIVFYQCGVDALHTDRLGRLKLTHAGLRERDRMVLVPLKSRGIPVVLTLGGGYSDPIEYTVEAHAATFRTAAKMAHSLTIIHS